MNDRPPLPQSATKLSTAAQLALRQGNKIEAIKILREERNLGLKDAKDLVDQYIASHPELQAQFAAAQAAGLRRVLGWLVILVLAGALGFYFLAK